MDLDEAIAKALKARKRLREDQGRIARRNARAATLTALRQVRAALDEQYPVIRKENVKRRKPRSLNQRKKGMLRINSKTMIDLLKAGVGQQQFLSITSDGTTFPTEPVYYAPAWMVRALNAKIDIRLVADAVRSQKKRRQINAMLRLSGRGKKA